MGFVEWFKEVMEVINLNACDQRSLDRKPLLDVAFWRKLHAQDMSIADAVTYWIGRT